MNPKTTSHTDPIESLSLRERDASEGTRALKSSGRGALTLSALAALLIAGIFAAGYLPKREARALLEQEAARRTSHAPTVMVVHPKRLRGERALALTANLAGLEQTTVYARAAGYVARWRVDMGDEVKEGQLLAELDAPELEQEIVRARASLAQSAAQVSESQAAHVLAQSTLERQRELRTRSLNSKQDLAESEARFGMAEAQLHVAQAGNNAELASLRRLEQLKSFARVLAPFAGTVTARHVGRGSLVNAGTSSPLFEIATLDPLRVMVSVPQSVIVGVKPGLTATLQVAELPEQSFEAVVTRTAGSLDAETHTMRVELRVNNQQRKLLPGMYATVRLTLPHSHDVLAIPATALIHTRDGMRVASVEQTGKVRLLPVVVERDTGSEIEVAQGLSEDLRVVQNPGPGLVDGLAVAAAEVDSP